MKAEAAAYEALTADQKALVDQTAVNKLTGVKTALDAAKQAAAQAAEAAAEAARAAAIVEASTMPSRCRSQASGIAM